MTYYVGFDIGGTTTKYGLLDETGKIIEHQKYDTFKDAEHNVQRIVEIVQGYQEKQEIAAVGVDCPGIVDQDGFMITAGAIEGLYDFPLGQTLRDALKLPVKVENDANAAAIAERWQGNARDIDNYVCLVLGTGIGGGIVINGAVYRGYHGLAGEIGWEITHDLDFQDNFESGSLNFSASVVTGLVRRYNLSLHEYDPSLPEEQDAATIIGLAHDDDFIARPIYQQFLSDVTVMLMNLIGTFDPGRILIGGGISANDTFMADLQKTFDEYIRRHHGLNESAKHFHYDIQPAGLRNNAGLLGAVYPLTLA